jgi:hypothetical protein
MDGEAKDKGAKFANDDFRQTYGQLKSQYDAQVVKGVHDGIAFRGSIDKLNKKNAVFSREY